MTQYSCLVLSKFQVIIQINSKKETAKFFDYISKKLEDFEADFCKNKKEKVESTYWIELTKSLISFATKSRSSSNTK